MPGGNFAFPTPDKANDESIKWTKDLIDKILKYYSKDEFLINCMESYKLYIFEKHFTPDQMYIYPTRRMLKEGALPHYIFIEKVLAIQQNLVMQKQLRNLKKCLQEQMPVQNVYESFKDFTSLEAAV